MTGILVMAKAPVPGAVKTRLRLAPEEAARLQAAMISDAVEKARRLAPATVAATPAGELDAVRRLVGGEVPVVAQAEGDLGDRMLAGARRLFSREGGPVLILGTDAPTLAPDLIRDAARSLEDGGHDAALAPSEDGGYVLIGLREPHADLFEDIAWSTPQVRRQTLDRARTAGLSVYETAPWHDVDTPEDLARLRAELSREPGLAPLTARLLAGAEPEC